MTHEVEVGAWMTNGLQPIPIIIHYIYILFFERILSKAAKKIKNAMFSNVRQLRKLKLIDKEMTLLTKLCKGNRAK